ncbi:MAG TPA: patatin-like phospholipase family protein [Anaeromyxobacter sp.]
MPETPPVECGAPEPEGEWLGLDDVLDRIDAAASPTVALSITGGGASGAWQAGVIAALLQAIERRRRERGACKASPRLVVGTSAGALNAFGLLLGSIRPAGGGPADGAEPFVASLWRTIGARNDGARFVTGGRARLVAWITRWRRWRRLQKAVALASAGCALALVNPILFGVVAQGRRPVAWLADAVLARPVRATLVAAALLAVVIFLLARAFGRALFGNAALESTLAAAARARLAGRTPSYGELLRPIGGDERQRVAMAVVRAWAETPDAPELVVTATDLTARWECLFALASPERCERLAEAGWEVGSLGPGARTPAPGTESYLAAVHEGELLRCVVASTSIPGVFPSQRIRMSRLDGSGTEAVHDFVDGGVLNNSPMNVAVDAGATHVISIELDPLHESPPLDAPEARGGEPLLPDNLGKTLATLLNMATTEDVTRTIAMNRMVAQAAIPGRRIVEVFRMAPASRDLDTLEFDGHYDDPFSAPSPSLVEWMQRGVLDARAPGKRFWNATWRAWPA